jgi:hypothetical protein
MSFSFTLPRLNYRADVFGKDAQLGEEVLLQLLDIVFNDADLKSRIDFNTPDEDTWNTFLMYCCALDLSDAAICLINNFHVDIALANINGETALHFAGT